jgi:hypothetical protein
MFNPQKIKLFFTQYAIWTGIHQTITISVGVEVIIEKLPIEDTQSLGGISKLISLT